MPGQIVIAYGDKLLSSYNTSQLLLSICKALNANRNLFVDSSVIYFIGRSLCDHKLSEFTEQRKKKRKRALWKGQALLCRWHCPLYKSKYLLFCLLISLKVSLHCPLLLLLHHFVLETWELTGSGIIDTNKSLPYNIRMSWSLTQPNHPKEPAKVSCVIPAYGKYEITQLFLTYMKEESDQRTNSGHVAKIKYKAVPVPTRSDSQKINCSTIKRKPQKHDSLHFTLQ